jgi:hypothetical protein
MDLRWLSVKTMTLSLKLEIDTIENWSKPIKIIRSTFI